jgi:hypothetical protein
MPVKCLLCGLEFKVYNDVYYDKNALKIKADHRKYYAKSLSIQEYMKLHPEVVEAIKQRNGL